MTDGLKFLTALKNLNISCFQQNSSRIVLFSERRSKPVEKESFH